MVKRQTNKSNGTNGNGSEKRPEVHAHLRAIHGRYMSAQCVIEVVIRTPYDNNDEGMSAQLAETLELARLRMIRAYNDLDSAIRQLAREDTGPDLDVARAYSLGLRQREREEAAAT